MFFNSQIKTFGLDISDRSLKLALINMTNRGLKLTKWYRTDMPEGILINGEIKNEDQLVKYIKKTINDSGLTPDYQYVVACLPDIKTFSKLIKIKAEGKDSHKPENLRQLIKKELPNHIPLPVETIDFDWQIIDQNKEQLKILVGVAPKEIVYSFGQALKKSGLFPIALEIEAEAILRAIFNQHHPIAKQPLCWIKEQFSYYSFKLAKKKQPVEPKIKNWTNKKFGQDKVYLIVDFGANRSALIVWSNETINFTSSLKTVGDKITQLISQKFKMDFRQAEKLKLIYGLAGKKNKPQIKKIIQPAIKELCQEIEAAKDYYENHFGEFKKFEIILSGGCANLPGLGDMLTKELKMPTTLADPMINLIGCSTRNKSFKNKQDYTTAIGLALRSHFINDF